MGTEKYKELMINLAENALVRGSDKGNAMVDIDDKQYRTPDEADGFAAEATQAVADAAKKGHGPLMDTIIRYEVYRGAVNGLSFYRHQMDRTSKIPAALNHLSAIGDTPAIADILFKEKRNG